MACPAALASYRLCYRARGLMREITFTDVLAEAMPGGRAHQFRFSARAVADLGLSRRSPRKRARACAARSASSCRGSPGWAAERSRIARDVDSRDVESIDDLPVDVLEVPLRLGGIAVDIEGDEEGAERGSLGAGVDLGPLPVAAVREGGGKATLLV